jgi:hypothetical protein
MDVLVALDISGAKINIHSAVPDPALAGHVRADFGLYEAPEPNGSTPAAQAASIQIYPEYGEQAYFRDMIPQGAQLCSEDSLRHFQWWQHEGFNYEIWGEKALIVSNRDQSSQVYCRPAVPGYSFVRAEIVRCLRAQLNHQGMILFHAGLAATPDGSRAVMIPGVKSQGKTSTVLWLGGSGFRLHSDEMGLYKPGEGDIECWGIPRRFALTAEAIRRFFPQHTYALQQPLMEAPFTDEKKHLFHLRGTHPTQPPKPSPVKYLIAPQLWRSAHSQVLPMDADEVQAVLYGSCEFNYFSKHELNRFTHRLSRQVEGYRLLIGSDSTVNFQTLRAHLEQLGLTPAAVHSKGAG